MVGITNSSIQLWLDFTGDTPPAIPPCERQPQYFPYEGWLPALQAGNCTSVCNNSDSMLDPTLPNNLVTCGLWASLTVMPLMTVGYPDIINRTDQVNALLEPFVQLGLNRNDAEYARATRFTVASGLGDLYNRIMSDTYMGGASFASACTEQKLFPYSNPEYAVAENLPYSLHACIEAICSTRTLNPDLGGIGVFISLLLQISIAIIACLALAGLEFWPSNKEKRKRDHSHALATALVEFHKNQCYFISAIEIAALVLGRQTRQITVAEEWSSQTVPLFDLLLSIPLSMNGFVPVIFTLTFVSRYGRLSWHIIFLSVLTIALSTAALATTSVEGFFGNLGYLDQGPWSTRTKLEFADLICGSNSSILQGAIAPMPINMHLVWAIYSNCIVWSLWCIAKHISDRQPKGAYLGRVLETCDEFSSRITKNRLSSRTLSALRHILFILIWMVCFGYHIYIYSLFPSNKMISQVWTFGQIIAVTVWVPAIVEFAYIEYKGIEEASKYKYPPGLQVVNMLLRPSAGLGNLELTR